MSFIRDLKVAAFSLIRTPGMAIAVVLALTAVVACSSSDDTSSGSGSSDSSSSDSGDLKKVTLALDYIANNASFNCNAAKVVVILLFDTIAFLIRDPRRKISR